MIIDGKKEAEILRQKIKKEIEFLKSKINKVPGLTVILIGDFAPSQIYVKNKEKSAKEVGINSNVIRYAKDVTEKEVIKKSDDFVKSEDTLLSVKIDQFAASSIDIRLICFTKTRQFQEWLNVKDTLALEIKNIVEKNKASFAFPSTSVYVEKNS